MIGVIMEDLSRYGLTYSVTRSWDTAVLVIDRRLTARQCQQLLLDKSTDGELAVLWEQRQRLTPIPAPRSPLPVRAQVQAWIDGMTDEQCEVAWQQRLALSDGFARTA